MSDHKYVRNRQNPGAIINTDQAALAGYKRAKMRAAEQSQRLATVEVKLQQIEQLLFAVADKLGVK